MTEVQILAKTYQDKLTVRRKQHTVKGSGESVFKEVLIYDNIPCALSQNGGSTPEKDGNKRTADRSMTIFTSPEIIMKDMDSITVETAGRYSGDIPGVRLLMQIATGKQHLRSRR